VIAPPERLTVPGELSRLIDTWHYLLSRRQGIEAFSSLPATEVIDRHLARAAALAGHHGTDRPQRLADGLRTA
jgi:hypothetical protein